MSTLNRGEIVEQKIKGSEHTISTIADHLGYSRTTFWRQLRKPNLSFELIKRIEAFAQLGLSKEFPEIENPEMEPALTMREKYYTALHEINRLQAEIIELRKQIAEQKPT